MDLGDGSYSGTWVVAGRFLADRNRRTEAREKIDIRLRQLTYKLPRIG